MAFSDFKKLGEVLKRFKLHAQDRMGLFAACPAVTPSEILMHNLRRGTPLATAIGTEKARSEMIVAPMLLEIKALAPHISLFSGIDLSVDQASGLVGTCDFLLSRGPEQFVLMAPVVALVEAKREDLHEGLAQCLAEMVAAQLFNQRENNEIPAIYGAVTTGLNWRFLRLEAQTVTIDLDEYLLGQPDQVGQILGILLSMITESVPAT